MFLFMLLAVTVVTTACSSSDDNKTVTPPKEEGTVKERLIGKWNQSVKLDDAVYQYNSDGTATFTNYYYNGKDVFKGAWRLLEGNVLHEVYAVKPDEDIKVDWDKVGGTKRVVKLVNSYELHLKDLYSENVKILYRQK